MAEPSTLALFAGELRRFRGIAGLSQDGLAQRINFSSALIAKIELCQRRPTRDFAKRCDAVLDTGGLLERIQAVLGPGPMMPWFRQWAVLEREALALRCFELTVIPGLLQTEAYARALLSGGRLFTNAEVEQHVATRMARQEILTGETLPLFTAVIDERVLRQPVGGAEVMGDQLRHIAKLCAEQPRIRVQVVPTSVGAYVGVNGPFVIATLSHGDDVGFLDDQLEGRLIERADEVAAINRIWETIRCEALSYPQSIELIQEVAES
ncbi:helix-turn-helix domain-containing protein [Plantactinospora soyae]|uniref:Transcriptional regulator with XRE-family HTH domain n=1 Tax=Plantactinospora soyae TaxID=1544732 RepID=A0A927M194_9ACTN|nr:helix-turn-helix transcriptional regulator [Plantactinospora soyae]MBE1486174.1 transcriptional regulator with XRE-family HTH domain [Plantactinospora soyae]